MSMFQDCERCLNHAPHITHLDVINTAKFRKDSTKFTGNEVHLRENDKLKLDLKLGKHSRSCHKQVHEFVSRIDVIVA